MAQVSPPQSLLRFSARCLMLGFSHLPTSALCYRVTFGWPFGVSVLGDQSSDSSDATMTGDSLPGPDASLAGPKSEISSSWLMV
jgi:hypothetical protein